MSTRKQAYCRADRDGDCTHKDCPQLRDGEPAKSRRSCPLWMAQRKREEQEE
jgi:hypothetical protein